MRACSAASGWGQDGYAPIVLPPAFDVLPVELEQGEEAEEADRTEEQRGELEA